MSKKGKDSLNYYLIGTYNKQSEGYVLITQDFGTKNRMFCSNPQVVCSEDYSTEFQ